MGERPERRILDAMRRLIAGAILSNHEVAERLGVGPTDAQFLSLLEFHGPLSPGQLARLSGLTTGTVTGVLDRLERAGYARREPDPGDRRRVIVSRDENRIAREIAPLYEPRLRQLAQALERYDAAELEVIAEFLGAVAGPPGGPAPAPRR